MSRDVRWSLLRSVAAGLLVVLAYFAGGVSGYGKGWAAASYSESANAWTTALVLENLDGGNQAAAVRLLESRLEAELARSTVGRSAFSSLFNFPRALGVGSEAPVDELAARGARYWLARNPGVTEGRALVVANEVMSRSTRDVAE